MKAKLSIERVVLDGVPLATREIPAFREAVEMELASLLSNATPGWLRQRGATPRLSAPDVRIVAGGPARLGRQLARSIYASIGREK